MRYDAILIEKPGEDGLTKSEVMDMYDSLKENEAYPIEIENANGESSAMGFITCGAAYLIDFDYEASGLNEFVGRILADVNLENPSGIYKFKGLRIFLSNSK